VNKVSDHSKSLRGLKGEDNHELDCTLVLADTQFEDNTEEHHWECEVDSSSNSSARGHFLALNVEYDEDYKDPLIGPIQSGDTTLHADDAIIVSGSEAILRGIGMPNLAHKAAEHRRRLSTTGIRSVLVVRVDANDATTSAPEEDLAREVFGIIKPNGVPDAFNLASAVAECSYNKLKLEPTSDRGNNGVYTVSINDDVVGQRFGSVRNVVLDQLRSDFQTSDLNSLFDHVMVCMPPGTVTNTGVY